MATPSIGSGSSNSLPPSGSVQGKKELDKTLLDEQSTLMIQGMIENLSKQWKDMDLINKKILFATVREIVDERDDVFEAEQGNDDKVQELVNQIIQNRRVLDQLGKSLNYEMMVETENQSEGIQILGTTEKLPINTYLQRKKAALEGNVLAQQRLIRLGRALDSLGPEEQAKFFNDLRSFTPIASTEMINIINTIENDICTNKIWVNWAASKPPQADEARPYVVTLPFPSALLTTKALRLNPETNKLDLYEKDDSKLKEMDPRATARFLKDRIEDTNEKDEVKKSIIQMLPYLDTNLKECLIPMLRWVDAKELTPAVGSQLDEQLKKLFKPKEMSQLEVEPKALIADEVPVRVNVKTLEQENIETLTTFYKSNLEKMKLRLNKRNGKLTLIEKNTRFGEVEATAQYLVHLAEANINNVDLVKMIHEVLIKDKKLKKKVHSLSHLKPLFEKQEALLKAYRSNLQLDQNSLAILDLFYNSKDTSLLHSDVTYLRSLKQNERYVRVNDNFQLEVLDDRLQEHVQKERLTIAYFLSLFRTAARSLKIKIVKLIMNDKYLSPIFLSFKGKETSEVQAEIDSALEFWKNFDENQKFIHNLIGNNPPIPSGKKLRLNVANHKLELVDTKGGKLRVMELTAELLENLIVFGTEKLRKDIIHLLPNLDPKLHNQFNENNFDKDIQNQLLQLRDKLKVMKKPALPAEIPSVKPRIRKNEESGSQGSQNFNPDTSTQLPTSDDLDEGPDFNPDD